MVTNVHHLFPRIAQLSRAPLRVVWYGCEREFGMNLFSRGPQSTTVGAPSRFPICTYGSGLGWALQSWMQQSSSIWLNLNDSDSGHFNLLIRKVDLSSGSFPFLSLTRPPYYHRIL